MRDQSVDTRTWYNNFTLIQNLLDPQVDVLLDAESEVAVLREVLTSQLVLLDLEATLKNLLSLKYRKNYTTEK